MRQSDADHARVGLEAGALGPAEYFARGLAVGTSIFGGGRQGSQLVTDRCTISRHECNDMNRRHQFTILLLDLVWIALAFFFAYALRYHRLDFGIETEV